MKSWLSSLLASGRAMPLAILERATLLRSLKTALLVGSILALVNHGPALLTGHFTMDDLAPLGLSYLVPFAVATYGQIQGKRQHDQENQQ